MGGACPHRIPCGSDRTLLVAVLYMYGDVLDRSSELDFRGGPSGTSRLEQARPRIIP
jgi:hypothetical protein